MHLSRTAISSRRHGELSTRRGLHAQKVQHASAAASAKALERRFTTYRAAELRQVKVFKYLGRMVAFDDNDAPA